MGVRREMKMKNDGKQSRATARRRIAGAAATLSVLIGVVGVQTGASASLSKHSVHMRQADRQHSPSARVVGTPTSSPALPAISQGGTATTTTPPVSVPIATFSASAPSSTTATVTWTNVTPSTLGRNGIDSTGYGAWNTGMDLGITPAELSAQAFTFESLVPGTTYNFTLTEADGSTLTTSVMEPGGTATTTTPPVTTTTTTAPPAATSSSLATGVYAGAADPIGVAAFDATTGTHSSIAVDYLAYNRGWDGMDGANGSNAWLFQDAWSNSGYQLSLGVPIIPSDSSGNPVGTLAEGASGAYNSYFVTLAQNLVAAGESNAYLRLGWEFDGNWYAWNATNPTDEANFAAYFRQIVTAMRSVAGENFKFVWNPDADTFTNSGYDVALAYPGSAYVDVIGLDAYDQVWVSPQTPANAWNQAIGPELNAAHAFAASQGKPLALTEWGSIIRSDGHGLGDDPTYINNMIAWMKNPANDVIFETYFDSGLGSALDADLTGGEFPASLAAFKADLG